jgi:metal-responsive CopG/Arc/MetJ family transcriptional regulator
MLLAITKHNYYNIVEVIVMLKNRERIGTSLPIELVEKLKDYSDKTMIPISKIIEKAIEEYLKSAK